MLEGRYLFVMRYLPGGFQPFGGKKKGSGRFLGSGVGDHQLVIFVYGLIYTAMTSDCHNLLQEWETSAAAGSTCCLFKSGEFKSFF